MTIERLTILSCDGECETHYPGKNRNEVFAGARADGWQIGLEGDPDYCPECRCIFGDLRKNKDGSYVESSDEDDDDERL